MRGHAPVPPQRASHEWNLGLMLVHPPPLPQRLVSQRFFDRLPCIIVTGKGVPDLATRWVAARGMALHDRTAGWGSRVGS